MNIMAVFSCLVISPIIIKKIGENYALMLCMTGYLVHTIANIFPVLPILLIGSAVTGVYVILDVILMSRK